jgi:two-component system, OmpR family, response regulator
MRCIIIEDEPQIAAYLTRLLDQINAVVDSVETACDAREALANFNYDLAIVDRMLPDGDGLDVVAELRRKSDRPAILMLTAKDAKDDIIDGLEGGADDYLGKPFEPMELIARVRAILRRPRLSVSQNLSFGNVELCVDSNEAMVGDKKVMLRRREALVFEALLIRRGRVVTKQVIADAVYRFNDEIESNAIEAQVSRLRGKLTGLDANLEIRSLRGIGYILRLVDER